MKKRLRVKRVLMVGSGIIVVGIVVSEIFLRQRFGLGDPPLYATDPQTGYEPVASAVYHRFGKTTSINAFAQRSPHDPTTKPFGIYRVLCVGDSITNGGVQINDGETYPGQTESRLNARSHGRYEVLAAAAGGWAISNELGYIQKYGTSKADLLILQVGTNDLFQPKSLWNPGMTSFPTRKPPFALYELWYRYLSPRLFHQAEATDAGVNIEEHSSKQLEENLSSIDEVIKIARGSGAIPIVWYIRLAPSARSKNEVYDKSAHEALAKRLNSLGVPLWDFTRELDAKPAADIYKDDIHPNKEGYGIIADAMSQHMVSINSKTK